ncbi:MAG: ribosomal-protein-alanine N-acetyltransferase [Myxococcota bacterium]|jgi:ribosomal-protein-alanine N-acetyltransferase
MSDVPVIETARLELLVPARDHAEALLGVFRESAVIRHIRPGPVRSVREMQAKLAELRLHHRMHGFTYWTVRLKATGQIIGDAGLIRVDEGHDIEFGVRLSESAWRKGYGTEAGYAVRDYAFDTCRLERYVAATRPGNVAARRAMEEGGMVYLGEAQYYGRLVSLYEIRRSNWRADPTSS